MGVANERSIAWGNWAKAMAGPVRNTGVQPIRGKPLARVFKPLLERSGLTLMVDVDVRDDVSLMAAFDQLARVWPRSIRRPRPSRFSDKVRA